MQITVSWQTIITAGAVIASIIAIITAFAKGVRWVDRQRQQDSEIQAIKATHNADVHEIKQEQRVMVYGLLACLKGLREQGCNGPVSEAIDKIEKHLNEKAHE